MYIYHLYLLLLYIVKHKVEINCWSKTEYVLFNGKSQQAVFSHLSLMMLIPRKFTYRKINNVHAPNFCQALSEKKKPSNEKKTHIKIHMKNEPLRKKSKKYAKIRN